MTHTATLLSRLRAAIPATPDEYHRTSIRLAIAEIEHLERVGAVRGRMYPAPPEPKEALADLAKRAANHVMTPDEVYEQKRSFVRGQFGMAHPEMSLEEVQASVDRVLPPLSRQPAGDQP
jgi:hypothetical protein